MATLTVKPELIDPLKFIKLCWPHVNLYDKQRQILYSLNENDETVVPAGNMLGKDFVAGLAVLYFFLSRHPCRVLTTSVDATQLEAVLWGEIRRFIQDSAVPLASDNGGNLVVNHCHLRKIVNGNMCGLSYVVGRVANQTAEGMLGHHIAKTGDGIPRTMFAGDEASGLPTVYWDKADTWADTKLIIGNCYECNNQFKWAMKGRPGTRDNGGDIPRDSGKGFHRKVIHIRGVDSPNVRYGLEEVAQGRKPSNRFLFPGVLSYEEYVKRRKLFDPIKQKVSLDAEFYEGAEVLMFPPDWLGRAELVAARLTRERPGKAMGCDTAEGGDSSSWSVSDDKGLIVQETFKTPDTNIIPAHTIKLIKKYNINPENVWFDRGGGGKQHVDRMRAMGYKVRSVAFGEAASDGDLFKKYKRRTDKVQELENKTVYKNRRAEMYGLLRLLIDPTEEGWGIPEQYYELRRQLSPIPLRYNREGVLYLLPKHKDKPDSTEENLYDLLGCSPDEADSLVLSVFGLMMANQPKVKIGAIDI